MMRRGGLVAMLALEAGVLVGCGRAVEPPGQTSPSASAATSPAATAATIDGALRDRILALPRSTPVDELAIALLGQPAASVDEAVQVLTARLAAPDERLGPSIVTVDELVKGQRYRVGITALGAGDDSRAGFEHTLVVELDGAGWQVTSAVRSGLCARGIDNGTCL